MIQREVDAGRINRVANSNGVRDGVCYHDARMDWSAAFPPHQTGIIVLSDGQDACGVFAMTADRVWQVHTLFGAACRGRQAIEAGRGMIEWMRPHADIIWGATPVRNCAARWFNRQLGAMPIRREIYEAEGEVEVFELRLN